MEDTVKKVDLDAALPETLKSKMKAVPENHVPQWQRFVRPDDVSLKPEDMRDEELMDRMPQPTGYRVLVLPYNGPRTTSGGIELADETLERRNLSTMVGYVLKVGPDAYKDKDKFPSGPWVKEGDWVLYARYSGARFAIDGGEVKMLNDDEILGTVKYPDDIYGAF